MGFGMESLSTSVKMKMMYNVYWKCTVFNVKEKMPEQENVSCKQKKQVVACFEGSQVYR